MSSLTDSDAQAAIAAEAVCQDHESGREGRTDSHLTGSSGYYRKADNDAQAAAAQKPKPTDAATAPASTSILEDATLPPIPSSTTAADFTTLVEARATDAAALAPKAFVA